IPAAVRRCVLRTVRIVGTAARSRIDRCCMTDRNVLRALRRLAVVERDDARGRRRAAAEQLATAQQQVQGTAEKIEGSQDSVRERLQSGRRIDPQDSLAANAWLMHEWNSLDAMRREERRLAALDERAQRDLSHRQARVKALERTDQRRQESRKADAGQSAQRE